MEHIWRDYLTDFPVARRSEVLLPQKHTEFIK